MLRRIYFLSAGFGGGGGPSLRGGVFDSGWDHPCGM